MKNWKLIFLVGMFTMPYLLSAQRTGINQYISLAGKWDCAIDSMDVGISEKWYMNFFEKQIQLPGTMDEAGYGNPNQLLPSVKKPQILHLTRKYDYVGPVWYVREVLIPSDWKEKNIELTLERVIWQTNIWVDGQEVKKMEESLVAPHRFDLTEYLTPGKHRIAIRVDNRKKYDISTGNMGHAYTNETQIMWNGIIGDIHLQVKNNIRVENVQVYPEIQKNQIRVKGKVINGKNASQCMVTVEVKKKDTKKIVTKLEKNFKIPFGESGIDFVCPIKDVEYWSELSPQLYELNIELGDSEEKTKEQVTFGMRQISTDKSDLLINGKKIFLRGTLECCIFPLTGYPPTEKGEWVRLLKTAREWGLNHLRFHSWCPPKAAFEAADELGFYLQVELPLWSLTVGKDKEMNKFLYDEAARIVSEYGNHPSFCFLSLGNELQSDFNFLNNLLNQVKKLDPRHLYTSTSFTFEGGHGDCPEPNDDFFITQWTKKGWVRGQGVFNTEAPHFNRDYLASLEGISVPLVTHEIGQYAVYPDLKEIIKYTGVLEPLNFKGVKEELEKKGLLHKAGDYLMASGKLAFLLYKEEIERAMKTSGISGFQLLDLHDFPGQGTALVGLLNAFWESKGIVEAEKFRQFCAPVVPLVRFPKATYKNDETFTADIEVANYGQNEITDGVIEWVLVDEAGICLQKGHTSQQDFQIGRSVAGKISCVLEEVKEAKQLMLSVFIKDTEYRNSWNIWVYPANLSIQKGNIIVTAQLTEAQDALNAGKTVLYNPPYKSCVGLQGKFVPVFWSPVHFPDQAGTMGLLLDPAHKAFSYFPTDSHTNWQWWRMVTQSCTFVTDSICNNITPIVECVDNFVNNRRLATVFEAKCLRGKLMVCSMDLLNNHEEYPEKKQLLYSLLNYMQSEDFNPEKSVSFDQIVSLVESD